MGHTHGHLHERLTPDERRDLVRHRCLVVPPAAVADLDEKLPSWPDNLWPFDWKVTIANPGHPQI